MRKFHAPTNGNQDQHLILASGITVTGNILGADVVAGSNSAIRDLDGRLGLVPGALLVPLQGCNPPDAWYKNDPEACPRELDPLFAAVPGISCNWINYYLFHSCTGLRLQVSAACRDWGWGWGWAGPYVGALLGSCVAAGWSAGAPSSTGAEPVLCAR